MIKITVDSSLLAQLHNLDTPLELCDTAGQTLGYFHPCEHPNIPQGTIRESPIPIEEVERRRKEKGGRSLQEILKDLHAQ